AGRGGSRGIRMVDRHRGLNQTLEKTTVRAGRVVPEVFPDLVGLEEFAAVEVVDAGQVTWIVFRRRGHADILSAGGTMLGTKSFDGLATWCRAIRHGHGAGLTLVRMFEMQAKSGPQNLRDVARRVAVKLEAGQSLEEALTAEGPGLPELFVSLAIVGERSGRIPEVFGHLEEYYRLQGEMRREFRSQAARPAAMFVGAVLVIPFTIFVLGMLAGPDSGPAAPIGFGLTGTSGAILFLVVVGSVVGGLILGYKLLTNSVAKQAKFHAWLLRVPVVGPCMHAAA